MAPRAYFESHRTRAAVQNIPATFPDWPDWQRGKDESAQSVLDEQAVVQAANTAACGALSVGFAVGNSLADATQATWLDREGLSPGELPEGPPDVGVHACLRLVELRATLLEIAFWDDEVPRPDLLAHPESASALVLIADSRDSL
jgi:hypothetical protein